VSGRGAESFGPAWRVASEIVHKMFSIQGYCFCDFCMIKNSRQNQGACLSQNEAWAGGW